VAWPAVVGLVAALLLLAFEEHVGPLPGERWAAEQWPAWPPRPRPLSDVITVADLLGTPLLSGVTVLAALWLVGKGLGRRAVVFLVVACAGVAFNDLLKAAIGPTSLWIETHAGSTQHGDNFPSGHVVYATVLAGALGVLAWERRRTDLVAFAAVAIVVMGPTRVLQSSHLVGDVVAGYAVGVGWLVSSVRVTGRGAQVRDRVAPDPARPSADA
jgi:membrane-associated phospholipid phosphatase